MSDKLTYPRKLALETPQTLATVVHAIMLDQYGEAAYDWDPVTCAMEVAADFQAEICTQAMDRWCAMQVVMGSDAFFKRLDAFLSVCNTLASGSPSFLIFDPVTSEEAAWAIAEVSMNRDMLPFSYSIQQYMRHQLEADGFDPQSGDLPPVFAEMFELRPDEGRIRSALTGEAADGNATNIEKYLMEQVLDLEAQFNRIPDLRRVDDLLEDGKDVGDAVEQATATASVTENTR
jgi:hypothetical protein